MAKAKKTDDSTPKKATPPAKSGDAAKSPKPAKAAPKAAAKPKAETAAPGAKAPAAKPRATKAAAPAKAPRAVEPTSQKKTRKAAASEPKPASSRPRRAPVVEVVRSQKEDSSVATAISTAELLAVEQDTRDLPHEYGDTKVVLLTRDPEWVFVYWEINNSSRSKFGIERGRHNRQLMLRVFESIRGNNHTPHYDVEVNDLQSSWYLKVRESTDRVRVALGLYDSTGAFQTIAESNEARLPRLGIAEESDVEFAEINDEVYNQIVQLSGGVRIGERLGSDDFLKGLQQRILQSLYEGPVSSGLSSGGVFNWSSGALSSGVLGGASSYLLPSSFFSEMVTGAGGEQNLKVAGVERRDFWLEVGVDVIVYGATQPDASVKFMGKPIQLTRDGTFRIRMVLPDTAIEFPVEATSADRKETRKVKPVVTRTTEGDPRKPA